MPQLGKNFVVKKLYLPSTENLPEEERAWVRMRSNLTVEDVNAMQELDKVQEQTAVALTRTIVEWNYTEADGTPSPIDYDHVCKMEQEDFDYLKVLTRKDIEDAEEGLTPSEKKTSSASLEEAKPAQTTQISISSPTSS